MVKKTDIFVVTLQNFMYRRANKMMDQVDPVGVADEQSGSN